MTLYKILTLNFTYFTWSCPLPALMPVFPGKFAHCRVLPAGGVGALVILMQVAGQVRNFGIRNQIKHQIV